MPTTTREPTILDPTAIASGYHTKVRRHQALLKTGSLQSANFKSAIFRSIATDAKGVIQIFNFGVEQMMS